MCTRHLLTIFAVQFVDEEDLFAPDRSPSEWPIGESSEERTWYRTKLPSDEANMKDLGEKGQPRPRSSEMW
jgi:hypothetical protein